MALTQYDILTSRRTPQASVVTLIAGAAKRAAAAVGAWHRNRLALRQFEAMPADLRKDFGWPAADRALPPSDKA
ncbi:hypothetical protein HGO38_14460 [Rhizobium sp. CG5]|uniref:hypothetical protein n=1 Tax=Rhizobium sp. CG5 TaxID=2726076 RepID=UPI0020338559|nr:hypothetical protein [Rhizobium sp. CG5]MCM2474680.1 hypothetical protein [Rhizobium sp. CG5]